jgi:hypothetical protein
MHNILYYLFFGYIFYRIILGLKWLVTDHSKPSVKSPIPVTTVTKTVRPAAQPAPAIISKTPSGPVIIDGTNLIHGSTYQRVSLLNVLALVCELNRRKIAFKCFFDANTFFTLLETDKDQAYAYRRLCHDYSDLFIEVPGRTQADSYVLDYADQHNCCIVSNDQYRDFAAKYSWLRLHPQRRSSFLVHSGQLQVVDLSISCDVPPILENAELQLREQLAKITGNFVPANCPGSSAKAAHKPHKHVLVVAPA